MIELRFTTDEYESVLFTKKSIPPRVGDYIWWNDNEYIVKDIFWEMKEGEEYVLVNIIE